MARGAVRSRLGRGGGGGGHTTKMREISLGDTLGFVNFGPMRQIVVSLGGVCVNFLKSVRKGRFRNVWVWGGGVDGQIFFSKRSCKLDDAQDGAMLEGPLIILNPNRCDCCPLPQGHWGTHPACELEHWVHFMIPKLACKRSGLCIGQNLVFLVGACRLLRPGCLRPFCFARGPLMRNTHPICTTRARSFPNQWLFWCIWDATASGSKWREFVSRHGGCLLTKTGSKQHRQHPKRTKISNTPSVQHVDPGWSE